MALAGRRDCRKEMRTCCRKQTGDWCARLCSAEPRFNSMHALPSQRAAQLSGGLLQDCTHSLVVACALHTTTHTHHWVTSAHACATCTLPCFCTTFGGVCIFKPPNNTRCHRLSALLLSSAVPLSTSPSSSATPLHEITCSHCHCPLRVLACHSISCAPALGVGEQALCCDESSHVRVSASTCERALPGAFGG